jgi:serine/threonine protein kinase/Flp pilus assembly protein TadD
LALRIGSRLGPYEIVSLLGSGGMGEVYRARDPRLDRDVALKALPERFATDADLRLRFEREAKAAAALSHPHICSIFDVGHHGNFQFIVMEYLEGETLANRLARGLLPLHTSIEYASQIAEALAEAHRKGIVHRDLKPSNVMLVRSGVKLVDFGVAKFRPTLLNEDSAASTALPDTARGTLVGTLKYMAPEQLEKSDVDSGADVFGLGVLLYEMVTGVAPFGADSQASIIAAILDREPPPASSFNSSVPADLDQLIAECLAKERVYRPTADLAAQRLRAITDIKQTRPAPHHLRTRSKVVRSLAVMPFATTLTSEAEDAFADGMADGLNTNLGAFSALRVISRTSVRRYKQSAQRLSDIASELRVDAVLRGQIVEKAPGSLTIDVELIDGVNEALLWSGRYDCERSDILNIQEQIAHSVASKIRVSDVVKDRPHRKRRVSRECHEAFLKARFQFDNRLGNWLAASFDALSMALKHDPTFAPAHAALSRWYAVAASRAPTQPFATGSFVELREGCRRAEEEARLALKLDPMLAEAHAALGQVLFYRWRLDESEVAYRRSLELGPNVAITHLMYSEFLCLTNRPADAIRHAEIAKQLDPFATLVYERLANAMYAARRFDECLAACRQGLELSPSSGILYYARGCAQRFIGDLAGSVESLTTARAKMPNLPAVRAALATVLVRTGHMDDAAHILDDLLKEGADLVGIAAIYVAMGQSQDALDSLELAFERESPHLLTVGIDPDFDPVRSHPRFRRLLNGIGLASYVP